MRGFIHATKAHETAADATAPDQFREVLLTGATGFVGRFMLRELLEQDDNLVVHCLVRTKDADQGLERLRDALTAAEIWQEEYARRICIVAGDMTRERFGLPRDEFDRLCACIDAVYHLAARVSLVLSYNDSREPNVLGLRSLLRLCLSTRLKHFFHASTLGIFPEYFCDFAREFSQSYIGDQAQPDLGQMKRMFPLGAMGYSWSKLVAEQALLYAIAAGLPGAIIRLPLMGPASTGYTQMNSFPARLLAAATQLEKIPKGLTIQRNPEPADVVSEIFVAISLNADRRFTIYNCCDPKPPHDDVELADFGLFWQTVSYDSFRRSCQALGNRSPLYGQWVLLDHFAPYWFDEDQRDRSLPISDRAIRQDCPRAIKWPALLIKHARSFGWIRRHSEEWPFPVPRGRLDFEGLMAQARRYAERMSVPFSKTYPEWLQAGLKQLVDALKSPDAGVVQSRLVLINYRLTRSLRDTAMLAQERQKHPDIDRQEVTQPVFIVGINRTGTTFLQRLLARDPKFWTLRRYETTQPVLASGAYATVAGTAEDPRRAYGEELMDATKFADTLAGLHRVDPDEPEEDVMLFWLAFKAWTYTVAYYVPEYGRWLADAGSRDAYAHHRRVMQHFTWQRRQRDDRRRMTWLLKMPFHLMELEALLEAYPDALFIQTHRDPADFMGSWNSMVERIRSLTIEPRPLHETGVEQLEQMSRMLNYATQFRESRPDLESRWVDVRFTDLVAAPVAVANSIYEQFGWHLDTAAKRAMRAWLIVQAAQRQKEPRHRYRLEDYGLNAETVYNAFSPYREFVAARRIM